MKFPVAVLNIFQRRHALDFVRVLLRLVDIHSKIALVDSGMRSADVALKQDCRVIEIEFQRLERILESYPGLGYSVTRNLAKSLSAKLRNSVQG